MFICSDAWALPSVTENVKVKVLPGSAVIGTMNPTVSPEATILSSSTKDPPGLEVTVASASAPAPLIVAVTSTVSPGETATNVSERLIVIVGTGSSVSSPQLAKNKKLPIVASHKNEYKIFFIIFVCLK